MTENYKTENYMTENYKDEPNIRNYTESSDVNDETYDLFENVLVSYLPEAGVQEKTIVTKEDNKYFLALDELYSIECSTTDENRNYEAKMADSLAFYKATGLIQLVNGNYVIDNEKLKELFLMYVEHNRKKKAQVYSKGPKR